MNTRPEVRSLVLISALFLLVPTFAAAQFVPQPPSEQHPYEELFSELYQALAEGLNESLRLPSEIGLTSGRCEQANAFYMPTQSRIFFCTELVDEMIRSVQSLGLNQDLTGLAIVSQIMFVTLHELGHAIVDVLKLPVLGREEDAVDQFAALAFSEEPVMATWAANFWSGSTNSRARFVSLGAFADEHSLNEQRFFNIICWTYGADPEVRRFLIDRSGLPEERAVRCPQEYEQLKSAWERLLTPSLKVADAFDIEPERNASGYWIFSEGMSTTDSSVRCVASGTLILWQLGETLSGSMGQGGSCLFSGQLVDNTAEAEISSGAVSEEGEISFEIANCVYSGRFEDERFRQMSGTMTCSTEQQATMSGSWEAIR